METISTLPLLVFSHLRWDFVFQRPQHLLTRFSQKRDVYFFEEPVFEDTSIKRLDVMSRGERLFRVVPHLPHGLTEEEIHAAQRMLIDEFIAAQGIKRYKTWYYTPMALPFTRHLEPQAIAYDCMDELSMFKGAHPMLVNYERELLQRADVVFTGGMSIYESKREHHANAHCFPSSIDAAHFGKARDAETTGIGDPEDQKNIPSPRIGFFGVIDERFDIELVRQVAEMRPDWQLVIIGPVVKIDPATLPRPANIHYLGGKQYGELPNYLAHWDIAMLAFARNDSTRFISPTKTPEYLAGGLPVISTPIRDVVRPYGDLDLVHIADNAEQFVAAAEAIFATSAAEREAWLKRVDTFLADMSWDRTAREMMEHLDRAVLARQVADMGQVAAGMAAESLPGQAGAGAA